MLKVTKLISTPSELDSAISVVGPWNFFFANLTKVVFYKGDKLIHICQAGNNEDD